jgi:hypothetical protein
MESSARSLVRLDQLSDKSQQHLTDYSDILSRPSPADSPFPSDVSNAKPAPLRDRMGYDRVV